MDNDNPNGPAGTSANNGDQLASLPLGQQQALLWDTVQEMRAESYAEKERRAAQDKETEKTLKELLTALHSLKTGSPKAPEEAPVDKDTPVSTPTTSTGTTSTGATSPAVAAVPVATVEVAKVQLRPTLPHVEQFGGDRRAYASWRMQLGAKLQIDGPAIGSLLAQYHYIFTRLKPPTQQLVKTFYHNQPEEGQTPEHFVQYLDLKFVDPNEQARARDRLWTTRQGPKESCAAFLVRFETTLYESGLGELNGNGPSTITWLKGAINERLAETMIHQPPTEDYNDYKNQLLRVSANLEGLKYRQRGGHPAPAPTATFDADAMDLRAGKVFPKGAGTGREDKRECYGCHKTGHIRRNCTEKMRDVKVHSATPLDENELEEMGAGEAVPGDGMEMTFPAEN